MASNNTAKLAILALVLLGSAAPARASVARAIAFDEKVERADAIILGRCVRTRSQWDPTGRWILTYSTFLVEKALKGAAVPEITVVTPGGQVGSIRQETVGIPQFTRGDQNVLFVKQGQAGPTVMYFDQGAYRVNRDPAGELEVAPFASTIVLVDSQTGEIKGREPVRSLRDFERDVHASIDRSRGRPQRYGVTSTEQRPAKMAVAEIFDFLKQYRALLGLLAVAIAISTYLLIRGR